MKRILYDKNPKFGGLINFASNMSNTQDLNKATLEAFEYGFRLGWQTCWHEHNDNKSKHKKLKL